MRAGILKPKSLSVDTMSSRLKILDNYLANFPLPDNKSILQSKMIEIVLSILPVIWVNSMITSVLELRKKTYEDLIEYLEKLESSLPDEPIPKRNESRDTLEATSTTRIFKKERPAKNLRFSLEKK